MKMTDDPFTEDDMLDDVDFWILVISGESL